jgi:hypothetical protein
MPNEMLAAAHHAHALLFADELELAQRMANAISPKHWHGPISSPVIYDK